MSKQIVEYVRSKEAQGRVTDLVQRRTDGLYGVNGAVEDAIARFDDTPSKWSAFNTLYLTERVEMASNELLRELGHSSADAKNLRHIRNEYRNKVERLKVAMEEFFHNECPNGYHLNF
jgi:hypothetical protein